MANAVVNKKAKDNYATFRAAITLVQGLMDDQVPGVVAKVGDADLPTAASSLPDAEELKSLVSKVIREIDVLIEDAKKYEIELIARGWRV